MLRLASPRPSYRCRGATKISPRGHAGVLSPGNSSGPASAPVYLVVTNGSSCGSAALARDFARLPGTGLPDASPSSTLKRLSGRGAFAEVATDGVESAESRRLGEQRFAGAIRRGGMAIGHAASAATCRLFWASLYVMARSSVGLGGCSLRSGSFAKALPDGGSSRCGSYRWRPPRGSPRLTPSLLV
jgi:hypothetical protein